MLNCLNLCNIMTKRQAFHKGKSTALTLAEITLIDDHLLVKETYAKFLMLGHMVTNAGTSCHPAQILLVAMQTSVPCSVLDQDRQ